MRLFLSSYHLGNRPEAFVNLVRGRRHAAIIVNAGDGWDPAGRAKAVREEAGVLGELGMTSEELDLRRFFGRPADLPSTLARFDALWIHGGESFLLRRAMYDSGFDSAVTALLKADRIVYAGWSAAVVVLAPTLRGIEWVDSVDVVQAVYHREPVWEGLNLLPYSVAVHYQSDHPESVATDGEVAFYERERMPYRTLRDGQALVVDGDREGLVE